MLRANRPQVRYALWLAASVKWRITRCLRSWDVLSAIGLESPGNPIGETGRVEV